MANYTKQQLRKKAMRKFENKMKKFFKVVAIVVLVAILAVAACFSAVVISNSVSTKNEIALLKSEQLYNPVDIDNGRCINVATMGNEDAKHTIVTISGLGVQDFSVFVQHIGRKLNGNTRLALVDRAGYGISDDSKKSQTVEQIIADYRTALQKAGIEGPYILLAHEFGGVYATYWSLKYPEEVEGIMYLDGTELLDSTNVRDIPITKEDKIKSFLYGIGFQRFSYNQFFSASAISLSKEESECSRSLNANSIMTSAYLSEMSLQKSNFDTVKQMLEQTDTPKLYVSSKNAFSYEKDVIKYWEYKNRLHKERELAPFYVFSYEAEDVTADAQAFIKECQEKYKNETMVFADKLGNCIITKMPGDVNIYEQKAEGLVDAVADFIRYLDGNKNAVKAYYEDTRVIDWENYVDTQLGQTEPTN